MVPVHRGGSARFGNNNAKLCTGVRPLLSVMLVMELWRKALRRCKAFAQRGAPVAYLLNVMLVLELWRKALAQRNAPVV